MPVFFDKKNPQLSVPIQLRLASDVCELSGQ